MPTREDVLNALKTIIDPDFGKDIVSLGFVKDININNSHVECTIELTTPACPVKAEFQAKAEEAIRRLAAAQTVKVHMTSSSRQPSREAAQMKSTLYDVGSIIAVSSCKGGVGKSTVAALLAKELSQRNFKVGLLDADIYGPSIPTLFNLYQPSIFANENQEIIPLEIGHLKVMSFGFLLGDAPAVMRGPIVTRYIQQLLHQTAWGKLDYLFIDMPPGTGDVQITMTQSVNLSGAVIVTTRQTLSLVDVARGILMFEQVRVPILGVIENMAHFICDQCGKKHFPFGGGETDTLKERFGIETLAQIPLRPQFAGKFDEPLEDDTIKNAVDQVIRALGKSSITQILIPKFHFDQEKTTLQWPNGKKDSVRNMELRLSCRCALCVNELTGEVLVEKGSIRADIMPKEIIPLGNYALGIKWNDGHSSGIYPYETIKRLAKN